MITTNNTTHQITTTIYNMLASDIMTYIIWVLYIFVKEYTIFTYYGDTQGDGVGLAAAILVTVFTTSIIIGARNIIKEKYPLTFNIILAILTTAHMVLTWPNPKAP